MALYYPHLFNGNGYLENTEGEEYADDDAAQAGAVQIIREVMAAEIVEGLTINLAHFIEIRDSKGRALKRIHFGDAVRFETAPSKNDAYPG